MAQPVSRGRSQGSADPTSQVLSSRVLSSQVSGPQVSTSQEPASRASDSRVATASQQWICDRYELKRPLGRSQSQRGALTSAPVHTFLAWDHQGQIEVVLKALAFEQLQGWKAFELFEREALALSQLDHPAIPRYLDYVEQRRTAEPPEAEGAGANASTFYLVQTYIKGLSLGERVQRGDRFSEAAVKAIARQGLEILSYLHGLNPPLIHRDIKPDNLICSDVQVAETQSTETQARETVPQLYLVDFGAAQAINSSGSTVIGTYGYMAPEQFRGQASTASDLYSLGATLLNLLTHQDPVALPTHRLQIDFRSVLNLSDDFAQWLDGLLAPMAADRFSSAQQALAALDSPDLTQQYLTRQPLSSSQSPTSVPQQSLSRTAQQPSNSHIRLQRRSGSYPLHQANLTLTVPPIGLQRELWALGGFALLWNGGLLYWLIMAWVMEAPWFYPLASAPLWGVGLLLMGRLSQSFFGQVRFTIHQDQYCLEQRLGPLQRTQRGPLRDWHSVDLRQQYSRGSEAVAAIALGLGTESVAFGELLSAAEKQWLVNELQAFLDDCSDMSLGAHEPPSLPAPPASAD